jgi:hypothetical protein
MTKTNSFLATLVVISICILFPYKAISQNGEVFAAVKQGSSWGYIDTTGKVRIPFNMEREGSFHEGFANVKYGKDWGFIDKKGTLRLKPFFLSANPFYDGRALVSYYDPKDSIKYRGYINRKGYMITILQNWEMSTDDYHDGFIKIKSKTNTGVQFGFKDSLDSFVIKPQYDDAGAFYEGKATVKLNGKWGFIDRKNNILVPPQYDDVYHFQDGLAYTNTGTTTSYINSKGKKLFTVNYDEVDVLAQNGMICFRTNGKVGFMNYEGKVVIKPDFASKTLTRFKDGLAPIQGDNGKYGYIDKKGNFVIQPQFDDAQFFFNNYASVKQNGKYGFIDKKGNWIIKPEYDDSYEFESAEYF